MKRQSRATERREAALKRGADDLMNLAEKLFEQTPRLRKRARAIYELACLDLYGLIERDWKRRQK